MARHPGEAEWFADELSPSNERAGGLRQAIDYPSFHQILLVAIPPEVSESSVSGLWSTSHLQQLRSTHEGQWRSARMRIRCRLHLGAREALREPTGAVGCLCHVQTHFQLLGY